MSVDGKMPRASVVVPCAGDLADLGDLVDALVRQQTSFQWRVVFVDNGLSQDARAVLEQHAARLPLATVVNEAVPGIGPARNAGVASSESEIVVFVDADDVPADNWLETLVEAVEPGAIIGGHLETRVINPDWLADTRGTSSAGQPYLCEGVYPVAPGGNMALTRHDFERAGGFTPDARPLEDFDFCLRAWERGLTIRMQPAAILHYRLRSAPRDLYRQGLKYGEARARVYRDLVDRGHRRPVAIPGWKSWIRLLAGLPACIRSQPARATTAWIAGNRFGRLIGSIRHRVVYL